MKKAVLLVVLVCFLASTVSAFWECEPSIHYMEGTPEHNMGVLSERTCYEIVCEPTTDPRYEICSDGWVRYPNGYQVVHIDRLMEMLNSLNEGQVEISNLMIDICADR